MIKVENSIETFIVTLSEPTECYSGTEVLPLSTKVWFSEILVCMEESPFTVPADVLYEKDTRLFTGVTFEITNPDVNLERAIQMANSLSPAIVRINDFSSPELRSPYPMSMQDRPYFEIIWKQVENFVYECAQLEYGFWEWFYLESPQSIGHDSFRWSPPVGFGIRSFQQVLQVLDLRFYDDLNFPELDLKITERQIGDTPRRGGPVE